MDQMVKRLRTFVTSAGIHPGDDRDPTSISTASARPVSDWPPYRRERTERHHLDYPQGHRKDRGGLELSRSALPRLRPCGGSRCTTAVCDIERPLRASRLYDSARVLLAGM